MSDKASGVRYEVSLAGRFIGLSIIGTAVIFIIFLEKFGSPEWIPLVKYVLAGALALGIGVPLLFFRRPVGAPASGDEAAGAAVREAPSAGP